MKKVSLQLQFRSTFHPYLTIFSPCWTSFSSRRAVRECTVRSPSASVHATRGIVVVILAYGMFGLGVLGSLADIGSESGFGMRSVAASESTAAVSADAAKTSTVSTGSDVRNWTDASGKFTVRAGLAAYDGKTVVLRKETGSLVTLAKSKLSEQDQAFLDRFSSKPASTTATSADESNPFETATDVAKSDKTAAKSDATKSDAVTDSVKANPAKANPAKANPVGNAGQEADPNAGQAADDTLWTLIDGSQIRGTVAGFGSIDMVFTRTRGSVYADGRLLRDYPKDYQQVIRLSVETSESIRVRDNSVLDRWVAKQRDGRSIHLEGVYIVCDGQQYLLPMRLIRSQDAKRIQADYNAWYQKEELPRLKAEREKQAAKAEDQKAKDEEREYQENKERRDRAFDELQHRETLRVLAESTGPMYRWRVFMVGSVGAMTRTFWTTVPARSTDGARLEAERRHPGYRATAVDLVGSVYPYPYDPIPGPMPGPVPNPTPDDPMPEPGMGAGMDADVGGVAE